MNMRRFCFFLLIIKILPVPVLLQPQRYIKPYWDSLRSEIAMVDDGFDIIDNDQFGGGGGRGNNGNADMLGDSNPKNKATNIAQMAAQEAKAAAQSQTGAAQEASHRVKVQYAEKALQASKAAEAAVAGKQQIVEQLEQEVHELELGIQEDTSSLQNIQANVQSAMQTAQEAQVQLLTLKKVIELSQRNVANAEQVASLAQQDYIMKKNVLEAFNSRFDLLMLQLKEAKADYNKTKIAAYKAASAAREAKANASKIPRNAD